MPRNMSDVPEVEEWVNSSQAGDLLKISRQSVNKAINQGKFKTLSRIGRVFVIRREEVQKMAEERDAEQEVPGS